MTALLTLPETNDPIADGLIFLAGASVFLGASLLAGFGLAELLRQKDGGKECCR